MKREWEVRVNTAIIHAGAPDLPQKGRNMNQKCMQVQDSANTLVAKNSRKVGRPRVTERPGFDMQYKAILERLSADNLSRRQAARELNIGYATLKRFLDARKENSDGTNGLH
jgi:hypothetical protein